jgi:hypothetical protein
MQRKLDHPTSMEQFWQMLLDQSGLKLLLAQMPPGSSLDDALNMHRRIRQTSRTPCKWLDEELGVKRE